MKEPTEGSSFKPFDVKPKTLMAVLDSDGDGQLSGKEIDFATDQLLRLDANDNGQIDPDELPGVMMAAKEDPPGFDAAYKGPGEQVYKTIAGFDTDGNGLLSRSEMPSMPFLELISIELATNGIAKIYDAAKARAGGVANIIKAMSLHGASCRASLSLYIALMKSENGLDPATRELLATVVSHANDCYY